MDDDIAWWLALQHVPRIGPVACAALLSAFGHPRALFENAAAIPPGAALPSIARAALRAPDWRAVERDLAWLAAAPDRHALSLRDPGYPPLLAAIPDPPPVLFVTGRYEVLKSPQVSIVGSRSPSAAGRDTARDFAHALGARGLTVTSGLAIGIDAAAHRGALAAGASTVAVAGTGLDRVYPERHRELADLIARDGALVSEFPPAHPPRPGSFPRRNRIISGLSAGTLVVEAALGSGSLITARAALEQGREVFAIPGSIHNPRARGCHALLRQGAILVECVDDILSEIGVLAAPAADPGPREGPALGPEQARILSLVDDAPTAIDTLVARSGLGTERLYRILLDLELKDYIHSAPGGAVMRRRPGK